MGTSETKGVANHQLQTKENKEKLGQCVEDINECCSGGCGWSKGELVAKKMTMVRVHEDRIKEVLDS